jgi:hypothetical protein
MELNDSKRPSWFITSNYPLKEKADTLSKPNKSIKGVYCLFRNWDTLNFIKAAHSSVK